MITPRVFLRSLSIYSTTFVKRQIMSHPVKMGDAPKKGLMLNEIVAKLEEFAATKTAEPWDNVGLLIDPMTTDPIKQILLTNDLTETVLNEAVALNAGLIISYHPPIFKGLKSLTSSSWKERIVVQCVKNSIALFSPHTSWDVVDGGVNDWFAKSLSPKSITPITESGCGRLCQLGEAITLKEAIRKVKLHLDLPYLRLALAAGQNIDSKINNFALCAGSGSSVLAGVKADLYLTGEMLHHDVLEATQNKVHVILTNHSDSERGFLKYFAPVLENELLNTDVKVFVSQSDTDPLKTV